MTDAGPRLSAFKGVGIELEYMIVDRQDLSVRPVADRLLRQAAGGDAAADVDRGILGWSNEFAMHVIEIKNQRPTAVISILPDAFENEVRAINRLLEGFSARLMPTSMHPWMNPATESRLWLETNDAIYRAYDRIFDTKSHGWSNLQSMHINLPFSNDDEFDRLHAAVRLILPIIPALSASSPFADGVDTGYLDYRMKVYGSNTDRVPSIAGMVIPDHVATRAGYEQRILAPMYRDIAPFDPEGVLRREWLNSRGAIPRFDRNAIEIRVIDVQECPKADLAIAAVIISLVKTLFYAEQSALARQRAFPTAALAEILQACIKDGDQALIDNRDYLDLLEFPEQACTAQELWSDLVERMAHDDSLGMIWQKPLHTILRHGPLARRLLRAVGKDAARESMSRVYRELCDCLQEDRMFLG